MKREDCTVFYDAQADRLIYIGRPADEEYWDDHWIEGLSAGDVKRPNRFVVQETERWLPKGAKVIDGGCGLAHSVYSLQKAGFDAYGVDYAEKTVAAVRRAVPELKVSVADVRSMPDFADDYFDGYWSLGVVEHFFDGFDPIAAEIHRVLRPGGFAFVTVPTMSALRSAKARTGNYPAFTGDRADFYQFVLPAKGVIEGFERNGFKLRATKSRGGVKGLKDEVPSIRGPLQRLFDSRNRLARAVKAATDLATTPWAHHTKFYVFQK